MKSFEASTLLTMMARLLAAAVLGVGVLMVFSNESLAAALNPSPSHEPAALPAPLHSPAETHQPGALPSC